MTTTKKINIDDKYWFYEIILEPGDIQEISPNAQCSTRGTKPLSRACMHGVSDGIIIYNLNGDEYIRHSKSTPLDEINLVSPPEGTEHITISSELGATYYCLSYKYNAFLELKLRHIKKLDEIKYRYPNRIETIDTKNLKEYTIPEDGCIAHLKVTNNFSIDPKAYSVLKDEIIDVSETNSIAFISDNYTYKE